MFLSCRAPGVSPLETLCVANYRETICEIDDYDNVLRTSNSICCWIQVSHVYVLPVANCHGAATVTSDTMVECRATFLWNNSILFEVARIGSVVS